MGTTSMSRGGGWCPSQRLQEEDLLHIPRHGAMQTGRPLSVPAPGEAGIRIRGIGPAHGLTATTATNATSATDSKCFVIAEVRREWLSRCYQTAVVFNNPTFLPLLLLSLSNRGCAPEPATEPDSVDPLPVDPSTVVLLTRWPA